ncbi:uncharacterized protein BKA78DRAFT_320172 [Phyllosticta capitalensis]|uniref:uncharacterized protein n=1 Tax=Phyllosticta capitalensis TaxID=121624 RepID=UPI00313151A3
MLRHDSACPVLASMIRQWRYPTPTPRTSSIPHTMSSPHRCRCCDPREGVTSCLGAASKTSEAPRRHVFLTDPLLPIRKLLST